MILKPAAKLPTVLCGVWDLTWGFTTFSIVRRCYSSRCCFSLTCFAQERDFPFPCHSHHGRNLAKPQAEVSSSWYGTVSFPVFFMEVGFSAKWSCVWSMWASRLSLPFWYQLSLNNSWANVSPFPLLSSVAAPLSLFLPWDGLICSAHIQCYNVFIYIHTCHLDLLCWLIMTYSYYQLIIINYWLLIINIKRPSQTTEK